MTRSTPFESFYEEWVNEIERQPQAASRGRKEDSFWEGPLAVKTLKDAGALWIVLPTTTEFGEFMPKFVLDKLFREIRWYTHYRGYVADTNRAFRDLIDILSGTKERLSTFPTPLRELKARFKRCAGYLEKECAAIRREQERYWREAQLGLPDEMLAWPVRVVRNPDVEVKRIRPAELDEWEKILSGARYPSNPAREIDLDARLQLRLGLVLRFYFRGNPKVPLITVSRLVVLAYIAGDLTREKDDDLWIADKYGNPSRRKLTVSLVDQKLRAAGLQRSFT